MKFKFNILHDKPELNILKSKQKLEKFRQHIVLINLKKNLKAFGNEH